MVDWYQQLWHELLNLNYKESKAKSFFCTSAGKFSALQVFAIHFRLLSELSYLSEICKLLESNIWRKKNVITVCTKLYEEDFRQIVEKNKNDPLFRGTLNQLEIYNQLKQHLINQVTRYRKAGRTDIANLIIYSMTEKNNNNLNDNSIRDRES